MLLPVADGLRQVHAAGFLHRDIKPSNIFVRRSDESPVLLDFGSARQALGRKSKSMTAIASAGYSPPEQYESQGAQGPWTDIYALSALCHRAITGETPMEAQRRQSQLLRSQVDPLPRLAEAGVADYSPAFLEAVDWGLRVIETERPQTLDDWLAQLGDTPAAISAGRRTGSPTPPEAPVRPVAQERARFGAKGALLAGAAVVAVGVALYFSLVQLAANPRSRSGAAQGVRFARYPVGGRWPGRSGEHRFREGNCAGRFERKPARRRFGAAGGGDQSARRGGAGRRPSAWRDAAGVGQFASRRLRPEAAPSAL